MPAGRPILYHVRRPKYWPRRGTTSAIQYRPVDKDAPKSRKNTIRAVIAWTGTVLILSYLFFTTDRKTVMEAISRANLILFAATALGAVAVTWMTDVASVRQLLRTVGIKVGFGEFARIKGASYLLNIVNYNLALVMMAAVVKKRSSKGWGSAGSPFILLNFIDLAIFSLFVQIAMLSGHSPLGTAANLFLTVMTAAGLIAAPVLCILSHWEKAPGLIGKVLKHDIMAAFRLTRPLPLLGVTAMRLVLIIEYGVMNLLFWKSFGVDVPFLDLMFFMAITSFVAMIPISVSGIGSTQYVMRDLYGRYVPAGMAATAMARSSVVDAVSTAGIFGILIIRVVLGVFCMRGVTRYISDNEGDRSDDGVNT